jgi:hypothetical protein
MIRLTVRIGIFPVMLVIILSGCAGTTPRSADLSELYAVCLSEGYKRNFDVPQREARFDRAVASCVSYRDALLQQTTRSGFSGDDLVYVIENEARSVLFEIG